MGKRRMLGGAAAALVLLVACGGGGGGDGDDGGPPGSIDIGAANRVAITRAMMVSVQGGSVGGVPAVGAAPAASTLAAWVRRASRTAPREAAAGIIGPLQVDCAISGFLTLTLDDRDDNGETSVGDVLSLAFSDCSDVPGEAISGSMSAQYSEVVPSPFTLGAAVRVDQFTVVQGVYNATLDGAFALRLQETGPGTSTLRMVASNALTLRAIAPAYTDTVTMQDGYRIDVADDAAAAPPGGGTPGRSQTSVAGRLASTVAGGWFTVSTTQPVVQYADDGYPRAGALEALGRTGSLQAQVLSSTDVRIDIDANGDGSTDESITLPWSQLL